MNYQERAIRAMKEKHQAQIAAHENAYGSKLGMLKTHPTKKQLDDAYLDFRNEKYGKPKPKKKAVRGGHVERRDA